MFIVNFTSGIGNQLFQYAFSEFLKSRYKNSNVKIMDSTLHYDQLNILDIFDLKIDWINEIEKSKLNFFLKQKKFLSINFIRALLLINCGKIFNIIDDRSFKNKDIINSNKNFLFYGYWQNIYFLKNQIDFLKNKLNFKTKINLKEIDQKLIKYSDLVGIHIRGGDYLKKKNIKIFSQIREKYYLDNIINIKNQLRNPFFIIFTDDLDYARSILPYKNFDFEFISNFSENRLDDFQFLSQCDHFIIPNSTFSWWASFLSKNKNKLIAMPQCWFNKENSFFNLNFSEINSEF